MTVFFNGAKPRTADFVAGDVGLVPKTLAISVENTGYADLVFLEMFKASRFEDLALSDGTSGVVNLDDIDWTKTVQMNAENGAVLALSASSQ